MPGYMVYRDDDAKLKAYRRRVHHAENGARSEAGTLRDYERWYMNSLVAADFPTVEGNRIMVPKGVAVIDAMYAALTAVEVDISITNVGVGTRDQGRLAEAGIRQVWRDQKVGEIKGDPAVKDSLITGLGYVRVGYDYEETEVTVPRSDAAVQANVDAVISGALTSGLPPPPPAQIAQIVPLTEKANEVQRDRVVVDYVPWDQVLYDPSAKRWEDLRWVAQVDYLPEWEVKQNPEFRNYLKGRRIPFRKLDELRPDTKVRRDDVDDAGAAVVQERKHRFFPGGWDDAEDGDDLRFTVYTMYDLDSGTTCTFLKNGDFLLNEAPNPFAVNDDREDRNPFVALILRRAPRRVRGLSDMEVLKPSLEELNRVRSALTNYLERFVPKLLAEQGWITDAGKRALRSREYGAVVETAQGKSPQDVKPMDPPALPAEVFNVPEKLENAINDATGANELVRGIFPDRRRTATETNAVMSQSQVRSAEKINAVERFYKNIARRVLQLMQMFYEKDRMVKLVDIGGDVEWAWNAEDIVMESAVEVHLTPKEQITSQSKMDKALALVNLLGPLPEIDRIYLVKYVAQEMGVPDDVISDMLKTPGEMRQEQQQQMADQTHQTAQDATAQAAGQAAGSLPPVPVAGSPSQQPYLAGTRGAATAAGDLLPGGP